MTDEEFAKRTTELALQQGFINGLSLCIGVIYKQIKREEDWHCKAVLAALGSALVDTAQKEDQQLAAELEQLEQDIKQGVGDE